MQPTTAASASNYLQPCTLTAQEEAFLQQFRQTTTPKVSEFYSKGVQFRIFNFTKHDVSMSHGNYIKIGPDFVAYAPRIVSDLHQNYSITAFEPTYVVVYDHTPDIILHTREINSDAETKTRTLQLNYSTQFNRWIV